MASISEEVEGVLVNEADGVPYGPCARGTKVWVNGRPRYLEVSQSQRFDDKGMIIGKSSNVHHEEDKNYRIQKGQTKRGETTPEY